MKTPVHMVIYQFFPTSIMLTYIRYKSIAKALLMRYFTLFSYKNNNDLSKEKFPLFLTKYKLYPTAFSWDLSAALDIRVKQPHFIA